MIFFIKMDIKIDIMILAISQKISDLIYHNVNIISSYCSALCQSYTMVSLYALALSNLSKYEEN